MKNAGILILGLLMAAPLFAQDEVAEEPAAEESVPAETAPADAAPAEEAPAESAPADETAVETTPVEEAPAEEATEEVVEEAPAESAPAEEAATEEVAESEGAEEGAAEGLPLYLGLDVVNSTVSLSDPDGQNVGGGMYRLRVGTRLSDEIGAEFHYGFDNSGDGEAETGSYYGLFVVPTATLFETVELAFPVGWATMDVTGIGDVESGIAYGLDAELPIRRFGEDLPDLRLTLGYMVYFQDEPARVYGANFGLRWDFNTASNPFAGAGSMFSGIGEWFGGLDLNPFNDDEEAPAEEPAE